ncbi:hypothetical protein F8S13_00540 [Chloroflexia bacterium SDU3-3]|nr:hypothetical protein F8S13_00540 [Chloroflexia bacterium SDU3-3]
MFEGWLSSVRSQLGALLNMDGKLFMHYTIPGHTVPEHAIRELEEDVAQHEGCPAHIPDDLRSFGQHVNSVSFFWERLDRYASHAWGKATLPHLFAIYAPYLPDDGEDTDRDSIVFDRIDERSWVSITIDLDGQRPGLRYHCAENTGGSPLDLSLPQYLHTLCALRGLYGWQALFTHGEHAGQGSTRREQIARQIAALFPDTDITRLLRQSEGRTDV